MKADSNEKAKGGAANSRFFRERNKEASMSNKSIEFIYWFAYYNLDSPSVRYRAKYPLEYFKDKLNVSSYLVIPGYSVKRIYLFLRAYFSALFFRKPNSIIVIQRVQSKFIYANLLKILVIFQRQETVYDLDDADYLEHSPDILYFFVKNCEKIAAGSIEISRHLKQFNPNITYVTSPVVDLGIFKKNKNSLFTIGWIGGFAWGHKDSLLKYVFPALKRVSFKFKIVFIGVLKKADINFIYDYFKENSNIEIEIPESINWNAEKEIQDRIVSFDIGIATLSDNPIQISKSGIKAKQYLNNGVPVLSTNLPENNRVIVDGKNGYFCSDFTEFRERIYQFYYMSNNEYKYFSKNARESIKYFDHSNYFHDFEKLKAGNHNF
ncbi:MAG: glycosyltransferase [Chitinophagales bacterium]|nr:glycosyltransferase [Chitinophagales bacterium]